MGQIWPIMTQEDWIWFRMTYQGSGTHQGVHNSASTSNEKQVGLIHFFLSCIDFGLSFFQIFLFSFPFFFSKSNPAQFGLTWFPCAPFPRMKSCKLFSCSTEPQSTKRCQEKRFSQTKSDIKIPILLLCKLLLLLYSSLMFDNKKSFGLFFLTEQISKLFWSISAGSI